MCSLTPPCKSRLLLSCLCLSFSLLAPSSYVCVAVALPLVVPLSLGPLFQNGKTALMLASRNGHARVVELLLTAGGDPDLKDEVSPPPTLRERTKDPPPALRRAHLCPRGFFYEAFSLLFVEEKSSSFSQFTTWTKPQLGSENTSGILGSRRDVNLPWVARLTLGTFRNM